MIDDLHDLRAGESMSSCFECQDQVHHRRIAGQRIPVKLFGVFGDIGLIIHKTQMLPRQFQPCVSIADQKIRIDDTAILQKEAWFVAEKNASVKPHTTKVACFLMPPFGGCLLEASDCLSTYTVFAQRIMPLHEAPHID